MAGHPLSFEAHQMPAPGQSTPERNPSPTSPPEIRIAGSGTTYGDFSLLEDFLSIVRSDPARPAVIDGGRVLTYSELNGLSSRLAVHLHRQGVGSGVFVGLAMGRCADLVIAVHAVAKCGGAYVPLDTSYPKDRIARMLAVAAPKMILTSGAVDLPGGLATVALDDPEAEWLSCPSDPLDLTPGADDPIYCIFTSGSTGEPKGAVVTRRGFANLTGWYREEFRFGREDLTLILSAPGFDTTQKNFFSPLCAGGSLVIYPHGPYDLVKMAELIRERRVTLLNSTPSAFLPLLEGDFEDLKSLRLVILAGEPIPTARIRDWLLSGACRASMANTFGPTECTDLCACHHVTTDDLERHPFVPIGKPLPNVQLALFDEALQACGGEGELFIGGTSVGNGYLGDPVRTAEKFLPNPLPDFFLSPLVYRTGDRVRMLPDGNLMFLGRTDYQVKLRGFRLELGEIESVLCGFPGLRESAVVVSGTGPSAALVAFHTPAVLDSAALSAHLRASLPDYMIPSRFVGLETFPMTSHGKMDRLALAKRVPEPAPSVAPVIGNATQALLRGIWAEVLEHPAIGLDDSFFDLGGDSIRLARVHARVMKEFHRMLPITDLFSYPTIRSFAQHLDGVSSGRMTARERMEKQRKALAGGGRA